MTSEGPLGGERVLLLLPGTYMNESGRAVGEAAHFYKLALTDIVVFHDEIDLPPAKVRVKTGGGIAGHNGLRSIAAHVGNDYRRVRIGIGHPGVKELVHAPRAQRFRQEPSGSGSRRCSTSSPTMPSCWRRARTRAFRTRCISPWTAKGFGNDERQATVDRARHESGPGAATSIPLRK